MTERSDWDEVTRTSGTEVEAKAQSAPIRDFCRGFDKGESVVSVDLVGGLFPRGRITCLVGRQGVGKSWLLLKLASDLSNGGAVLGGFSETEPRRVLILEGEGGRNLLLERLKGTDWPMDKERVFIADQGEALAHKVNLDLDTAAGVSKLRELINEFTPDVVFVDSVFSFAPNTDERRGDEVNILIQSMIAVAREQDVALVLVHHTRKRQTMERHLLLDQDDVIGSNMFSRGAGLVVGLQSLAQIRDDLEEGDTPAPVLVTCLKSWYRYFKKFSFQITRTFYGKTDMAFDLAPDLGDRCEAKELLLEHILETYEPGVEFRRRDLEGTRFSLSTLKRALDALVKEGALVAQGETRDRRFCLPAEGEGDEPK